MAFFLEVLLCTQNKDKKNHLERKISALFSDTFM